MIIRLIYVFILLLNLNSCSDINNKQNSYYKVIFNSKSSDNKMSVIGIQTGINGGATVSYYYEFYFAKNINEISKNNMFLSVKGLDKYRITWNSINTIAIKINASEIKFFKSNIVYKKQNKTTIEYIVNNAVFDIN